MEEFLTRHWLEALFDGASALPGLVNQRISGRLRDRSVQSYDRCIDKGFCPVYALESMQAMYAEYHKLGGNRTIAELMEKLRELPAEKKERTT